MTLNLTVLVDNNTFIDRYFLAEPGVSYFIEVDDKRILFDCGYSDAFIRNAQKIGIDLLDLDMIVLSHGHLDHIWGLFHLIQLYTEARLEGLACKRPQLLAHPGVFASRTSHGLNEIGSLFTPEQVGKHFDLQLSSKPVGLTEKLVFMGEIERLNDFEAQKPVGSLVEKGQEVPDFLMDDTALFYKGEDGLIVITGCSHAGICNMIRSAQQISGKSRVMDIVGGLHLLNPSAAQMEGTIKVLSTLDLQQLHACHCTDLQSKIRLAEKLPLQEVGSGLQLHYE